MIKVLLLNILIHVHHKIIILEFRYKLIFFLMFQITTMSDEETGGGKGKGKEELAAECSVCGQPAAAHLHYGAVSCYSCRAFFRRGQPKQVRYGYETLITCNCNSLDSDILNFANT